MTRAERRALALEAGRGVLFSNGFMSPKGRTGISLNGPYGLSFRHVIDDDLELGIWMSPLPFPAGLGLSLRATFEAAPIVRFGLGVRTGAVLWMYPTNTGFFSFGSQTLGYGLVEGAITVGTRQIHFNLAVAAGIAGPAEGADVPIWVAYPSAGLGWAIGGTMKLSVEIGPPLGSYFNAWARPGEAWMLNFGARFVGHLFHFEVAGLVPLGPEIDVGTTSFSYLIGPVIPVVRLGWEF